MQGDCAIIKVHQGREMKEKIERRDADLSVSRDHPERKTEKGETRKPIHGQL